MTCTIIGIVVACSGAPIQTTPPEALALMKQHEARIVEVQIPGRPADATGADTPERALAIMKQHETTIVLVPIPDSRVRVAPDSSSIDSPRRRFGEAPWWWSELYSPWWYEPWVAKPWQLEVRPEPFPGP
jgi:hypothetical protein